MPNSPGAPRPRWIQVVTGVVVGALVAVAVFAAVGFVRDDPVEGIASTYRLSDDDVPAAGPVSLISVRDVREPSSIPGVAAPTGDRYVSLVVALERDEATAEQWFPLEGLTLTLHAVDEDGRRTELTPTDSGQRLLDGVGGRVRGIDPYWIRLDYAPPAGDVAEYEVGLGIGGDAHTFPVRAVDAQ